MNAQIPIGFLLSLVISLLAWRFSALNRSGALTAALSGGVIFGFGGMPWAVLLLTFFISSSALSGLFRSRKITLSEKFSKGSQRDWEQVLANGGLGAILAVLYWFCPTADWLWVAYAGAMAAVNADTWATELGVLGRKPPRLITTGKVVMVGTSGGVSLTGSLASLGGALLIASIATLVFPNPAVQVTIGLQSALAITVGGLCGSFFDSLLGATIQRMYYCPSCEKETERHPMHTCGTRTQAQRGLAWLNNDWVNFLASVVGALAALVVWSGLG